MNKKETKKPEALDWKKRLLTYSTAAGAALTMAGPADAAIRYSGPRDIPINGANPIQTIDINEDGANDFAFYHVDSAYGFTTLQGVRMRGETAGNSVFGATNFWFEPYRLAGGEDISPAVLGSWNNNGALNFRTRYSYATYGSQYSYGYGNFTSRNGYLGVQFDIGGNTHFGWVAYEGAGYIAGKITGWAYEDQADTAISAGDTGYQQPIPTLNQWGIIFLMALIVLEGARRIKRNRKTE